MAANVIVASASEKTPVSTAASANLNSTSAVASLTKPSPSRIAVMRLGTPSLRAIASGATTSGGETMAPSTNATAHGSPINQCAAAATTTVVNTTHPMARSEISRKLSQKACQLFRTPRSKSVAARTRATPDSVAVRFAADPGRVRELRPRRPTQLDGYSMLRATQLTQRCRKHRCSGIQNWFHADQLVEAELINFQR